MWKVLIFVVVLAVPIFGGTVGYKNAEYERRLKNAWKSKCYNVSGVDVDFERNDRLRLEYESCKQNAMDSYQLREDLLTIFPHLTYDSNSNFTFADQQKADVLAVSRKYCPKVDAFYKCGDILSPFFEECYDAEEIRAHKVCVEISQHTTTFFCKNEAESVATFIEGKVVECILANTDAFSRCFKEYLIANTQPAGEDNPILTRWPKPDKLCNSIEALKRCAVPLFENCQSSPTAVTLVKSLFMDVQTKTSCANITPISSSN